MPRCNDSGVRETSRGDDARSVISLLAEKQIDDPAAAIMLAVTAQVSQDLFVAAAGFFQRVGEDGEPAIVERAGGKDAVVVGGLGEANDGLVLPRQDIGRES